MSYLEHLGGHLNIYIYNECHILNTYVDIYADKVYKECHIINTKVDI